MRNEKFFYYVSIDRIDRIRERIFYLHSLRMIARICFNHNDFIARYIDFSSKLLV